MRRVSEVTAADVPEIGTVTVGDPGAFEVIWSVEVNGPAVGGGNLTCTVQESATATPVAEPPHGLVPAFNVKPNGLPDGASKEIADTFNAAVPVLRIVTSNGAGTLLVVTGPKSKDEGRTGIAGAPDGAGAALGLESPPPPPHPATARAAAAKSNRANDKASLLMNLVLSNH